LTNDEQVAPFVDGALSVSDSTTTLEVINPSNGRRLASIPAGCEADVDRAVASVKRAVQDGRWSEAPPSLRKKTLHLWADLLASEAAALDALDAAEMGKPVREAFCNASGAAALARFFAEAVDKTAGDIYTSDKHSLVMQRRVPRGVVAAVVPWNFPTFNAVLKLAPALAAGNCVVLKPSELSSRSAMRIAHLASRAGFPPGVLSVVPGAGGTVGRALALHRDVDMIAFTGSTEVGKRMLQYAGQSNMKVVMAECGGKSPQIVFADGVDLDAAADAIAKMLLVNQGQICSVGSRLLVQRSVETEMVEKIASRLSNPVIGDACDLKTTFGPLASAGQYARVMRYIETAAADGAQLVTGGRRVLCDSGGYFVEPTVFRTVPSARIAQEEIFGPVLSIIPFQDEAEAVRIANDTMYGLVAYIWTSNLSTGLRMARRISSAVIVNATSPTGEGAGHALSIEPARQSGVGTEGGIAGMESYVRRQLVWFNHG
jgi:acyl-CoA reductase-like NAD-dependent aldehyde dehydrogenase